MIQLEAESFCIECDRAVNVLHLITNAPKTQRGALFSVCGRVSRPRLCRRMFLCVLHKPPVSDSDPHVLSARTGPDLVFNYSNCEGLKLPLQVHFVEQPLTKIPVP